VGVDQAHARSFGEAAAALSPSYPIGLVHILSEGYMGASEQAQSSCQMACIALALMLIYFTVNHVGLNHWNNLAQAGS
jgi:hypothetical protein